MDKAEQPTIVQADRDAAAGYARAQLKFSFLWSESGAIKMGSHDDWEIVQAFARHRTTSLAAQEYGKVHTDGSRSGGQPPRHSVRDGLVEVFYIDCEFDGHNGQLLSIALVGETDSIHIKTTAPVQDDWVLQNVLPLMDMHNAPKSASVSLNDVGSVIRAFLGDCKCPVIIADSPVDIGRFCRALSTGNDGQWASADFPAMRFEVHNVDCYPTTLEGAVQHNAWWDAMALKAALSAIKEQPHD